MWTGKVLSILLEDNGQRTPILVSLPTPQAWPLLPQTALFGRKPNPKPAQSMGPDLGLVLGSFQGTGKSLKIRDRLEKQQTQSLRSLEMVRRTWLAQLPLNRVCPWPLGLTNPHPVAHSVPPGPHRALLPDLHYCPLCPAGGASACCFCGAWSVCGMQNNNNHHHHLLSSRSVKCFHMHCFFKS